MLAYRAYQHDLILFNKYTKRLLIFGNLGEEIAMIRIS